MAALNLISGFLAVQAAATLALAWLLLQSARRLFFHPLSKWPGPWLNAVSDLPEAYYLVSGRQHSYHRKLHDKYGPVVRVAPNELIFCGAKAWDDIYGNKPGKPDMEKSPLTAGGMPPALKARALTLTNWEDHVRQRKAFAHPFSNSALLQQEPLIQGWIDKLIAALGKSADEGKAVNMPAWFTYTTFDIIVDLCFDEPIGCLDNGRASDWAKNIVNIGTAAAFEQATRRVAGRETWLQGQLARWLVPGIYRSWRMKHFALSAEKTKLRLAAKDKEHKDFVYFIMKNNESKALLSDLEIVMNLALFIGAGSDTTALALSGWIYMILTNEKTYHKLAAEIRGTFESHKDISWNRAKDLPYLDACIKESMRLFPLVPGNLNRVVPPEGALVDGQWINGETTVSVSSWSASHSPEHFTDPYTFAPERWFESERAKYPKHVKEASQPFLTGPRGCIGKNLSYIEQRLIISHLLWHFDVQLAPESSKENKFWSPEGDMKHMKSYLIWEKPDLWVKLTRVVR